MNTLERFVWGVQTHLLARAATGDLTSAVIAADVVIGATFVDPSCIDEMDEPLEDERLYLAVREYCDWNTDTSPISPPQPAWLRFMNDEQD